jgi:CMP-N-acetylneuraminic acid synthetase
LKKNISKFEKKVKYIMDEYSSHDIDTSFDWKMAEIILEDYKGE